MKVVFSDAMKRLLVLLLAAAIIGVVTLQFTTVVSLTEVQEKVQNIEKRRNPAAAAEEE